MRRIRVPLLLLVLALVTAACGGGSEAESTDETSTSTTVADAATSTTAPAPTEAGADTTVAPSGGSGGGDGGGTSTTAAPKATPTNRPPDAGTYRFHTTGTQRQGTVATKCGTKEPVDRVDDTVLKHLSATDVRTTTSEEVTVLRYLADRVQLLRLDVSQGPVERHFVADPPVTYAPMPLTAGEQWSWRLADEGRTTTITQKSTVRGTETISVAGGQVTAWVIDTTLTLSGDLTATITLTSWVDPARRTGVQVKQHTKATFGTLCAEADTTSVLTRFTPA